MNRQARRRAAREGKKGPQWDILIPSAIIVIVLLIFIGNYLFPNLNLSTYAGASPRILRKIGDRGIDRLRADWPGIESFSFGHFGGDDEWATYQVEKKDTAWEFTDLETEKTVAYATNNLPEFYIDMPEVLNNLSSALHDKSYLVSFQQTIDDLNVVSVLKTTGEDNENVEQYTLVFNKDHNLDRIIYLNSQEDELTGYSFSGLYEVAEETE
ncbi:MAG: hypothetical protein GX033_08800 [Firmicutes bacterium]|nr:hypothetical protein [Bacillota bacterium]